MPVPVIPGIEEQVEEAFDGSDSDVHLYCCDPNLAYCGAILGGDDLGPADSGPVDCIRCEVIDQSIVRGCGAPFCGLRSRWRAWRQS